MTFDEFKELDIISAYPDYKSVKFSKMIGEIPEELAPHIEDKCVCGSDRMTNGVTLTCCNPRCYIKLGHKMSEMFSKFGAKNLGPSTCIKIMKHGINNGLFAIPSHVEIFNCFEKFEYILGAKFYDLILGIEIINNKPMGFYQMVQAIRIPGFGDKCVDYFKGIESLEQLTKEIDNSGGVINFMANRGVYDRSMGLNLTIFLTDIFIFEKLFRGTVLSEPLRNVKICITGPVRPNGVSMTRDNFVSYLNEISRIGSKCIFNITESGPITSSYVIADAPSNNRKYKAAEAREKLNPDVKIIYSSTDFVNLIKGEVEKCKQKS